MKIVNGARLLAFMAILLAVGCSDGDRSTLSITPPPGPPAAPAFEVTAGFRTATVERGSVEGATAYNLYYGPAAGLSPANYAALGGRRVADVPASAPLTVPFAGRYYFVMTSVADGVEGAPSAEQSSLIAGPVVSKLSDTPVHGVSSGGRLLRFGDSLLDLVSGAISPAGVLPAGASFSDDGQWYADQGTGPCRDDLEENGAVALLRSTAGASFAAPGHLGLEGDCATAVEARVSADGEHLFYVPNWCCRSPGGGGPEGQGLFRFDRASSTEAPIPSGAAAYDGLAVSADGDVILRWSSWTTGGAQVTRQSDGLTISVTTAGVRPGWVAASGAAVIIGKSRHSGAADPDYFNLQTSSSRIIGSGPLSPNGRFVLVGDRVYDATTGEFQPVQGCGGEPLPGAVVTDDATVFIDSPAPVICGEASGGSYRIGPMFDLPGM